MLPIGLLCILPVLTQAQLTIKIHASEPTNITVQLSGEFEEILTDDHRELFHITDRLLKSAIFNLTGQSGNIYIKNPTFGDDIYGNYNIEPVTTVLKPNRTKINVKTKEVFLNKIDAFNNDDYKKSQGISLTGYIEENVTCTWKQKDVFPVDVLYNIDVIGLGIDEGWTIKSSFGRNVQKTQVVPTSASFVVNLQPNRDVTAVLSATKVTLTIDIFYTVTLTGHVMTKFENTYLWGYENYDIKTVMESASMPHVILLSEEITFDFYTNCFIKVFGEDLIPITTGNGKNLCSFTVEEVKNESNPQRALNKSSNNVVKKSALGNNAVTNYGISIVLIACMLLKIQF